MRRTGVATVLAVLLGTVLTAGPITPAAAASASALSAAARAGAPGQSPPSVDRLRPASGPVDGEVDVVITGTSLVDVTRVLFGRAKATHVRVKSGHKIVVQAPAHLAGSVKVRVLTKHGTSGQSKATRFTYETPPLVAPLPPTVTRVSPAAGPTAGGTPVTVTGTNLTGATAVRFGSAAAASFHVVSSTSLVATTTAHQAGAVDVTVTTAAGSATLTEGYEYVPVPTLDGVSPDSGPALGSTVTLDGTGFTASTAVTFGGLPATDVEANPAGTELTATTPAHAPGWVDVGATTTGGTVTLTHGFLYVGGVTLTGVSPSAGPAAGGIPVTVTGSGFTDLTLVVLGNKPLLDVVVNPAGTSLTGVLPSHSPGTVDVQVSTQGDSATLVDGFTFVAAPTLASLSPVAGPTAGGTTVTLTGTGFQAGMQVRFAGTPATGVAVAPGGTSLTAVTPGHAVGAVDVTVSTPGGSATLTGGYTYVVAPTLTDVTPSAGPVAGGTTVALTGTGFRTGMQVTFDGVAGRGLVVTSATQATVTTPGHAAGAVNVVVTSPGGASTLVAGFTYVVPPVLTSLAPVAGPLAGSTSVTLTGTGFEAGMQVTFGGAAGSGLVVTSATQATLATPARATAGAVNVVVTTPGGVSTLVSGYSYVVAPTLASVTPAAGALVGGTSVTLTGSGFQAGMQVTFGGDAATAVSVSPGGTQLTALTPAHAAGAVDVAVSTPGGSDVLTHVYTYVEVPTLSAVSPDAGPVAGGTTVTLTGSGFRPGLQVLFGSTPAAGVSVNPGGTELTAMTPPHAAGAVTVSVATPGGSAGLPDGFTFVATPSLTALAPDAGPVVGGTVVTLTGSGFGAGMTVSFGGAPATGVSVTSGTSATAVAPAHTAGPVDVSLTTPGGAVTFGNSYTYLLPPTVTAAAPGLGPAAGGTTVTLTGTGFRAGMQVTFDGVAGLGVSVTSATQATVLTPPHPAGDVGVAVTTPGGSDTLSNGFTYVVAPTLVSLSPTAGPAAGGTTVTLTGTGLTGTTDVTFDGVPATGVVVLDDSNVTVTTPAHAAGDVDVGLTTPGGTATLTAGFTYLP